MHLFYTGFQFSNIVMSTTRLVFTKFIYIFRSFWIIGLIISLFENNVPVKLVLERRGWGGVRGREALALLQYIIIAESTKTSLLVYYEYFN